MKTTRGSIPRVDFCRIKNAVLGNQYTLSLVFAGDTRMRRLNQTYRKKSYTPNVLSFPISDNTGEIFINPHRVRVEARRYGMRIRAYTAFLFIHALLHLKGMRHGATMEKRERALMRRFGIT